MNPYYQFVSSVAGLMAEGRTLPLGGLSPQGRAVPAPDAAAALIFSPHPDDECLIGGLALRLMRETGMRVINVAVTLGSNRDRQQPRLQELRDACRWLGFELEQTRPDGLEGINSETRAAEPERWADAVNVIASSLRRNRPRMIFVPHQHDWNTTHVGTHLLVMDALRALPTDFECILVFTEYWAQMSNPNLMVESGVEDVADLVAGLSFHVGEVQRNPYHLRMPAWLQDNVRRGAEVVGGQRGVAPDYMFATLYRVRQWKQGRVMDLFSGGRQIGAGDPCDKAFGEAG